MIQGLIIAGLLALQDYVALHVLTCLIPAFLLAGGLVAVRRHLDGTRNGQGAGISAAAYRARIKPSQLDCHRQGFFC